MSVDVIGLAVGILVLGAASGAAWYLKKRMDAAAGLEVVGFALTLMMANVLQLVGVLVIIASLVGDR